MIFTDRTITVRKGESRIDEPIVVYRGDYELEVRFTILNSRFKFMSGTNLIESEKASYGQLAILTPYGGNIFSDIVRCNDGSVTFVLTADMLNQIEEVGLYSFQIRLMDYNKESRVSIPPIEFGIEVREPIASEDHDNSVNNAIVGYSIAKVVDPKEENVGDTFDKKGNYNKTEWETGDRISEGKLNKIEDAIDKINENEVNNTAVLSKRIDNNFNVLDTIKADKNEVFTMANMGQDVKEAMTGGSVAVVDKNAILSENIVDGQIIPINTSFFDVKNLFSPSKSSFIEVYVTNDNVVRASTNVVSIILEVSPDKRYILTFDGVEINRSNTVLSSENIFSPGSTYNPAPSFYHNETSKTINFSTDSSARYACIYIYTGTKYSVDDFNLVKNKITLYEGEVPTDSYDTINKNFLPKDILYESSDLSKYMDKIEPHQTTFFYHSNLLENESECEYIQATCDGQGYFFNPGNGGSFIFPVEPNTEYVLIIPKGANRDFILENSSKNFENGVKYPIVSTKSYPRDGVISFSTSDSSRYIVYYCYYGDDYTAVDNRLELYYSLDDIGKASMIKKEYLPNDILYESSDLSKYIDGIDPHQTTFFNIYNVMDPTKCTYLEGSCNTSGMVFIPGGGRLIVFPVNPSTEYVLKMPNGSNRTYLLSNTSNEFKNGSVYPILSHTFVESLDNITQFTTIDDSQYVLCYYYYGGSYDSDVSGEFGLYYSTEDVGKSTTIKSEYINFEELACNAYGKKILTMGDSITAINEYETTIWPRSWRKYFKESIKPSKLSNTAVPGATWRDKPGTVYDGAPVSNGVDNNLHNVMGNQLEKLLRARDTNHPNYSQDLEYDDDFDLIIIACGINDSQYDIPSIEEIETQFHDTDNNPITNLDVLDRISWAGAMRYVVDNLRILYPTARIYICTPIQCTGVDRYQMVLAKNTIISTIARRLSVDLIDTMVCGVYDMTCPSRGQEGDYNDGLHLSPQGASKMGKFIANEIKNRYY